MESVIRMFFPEDFRALVNCILRNTRRLHPTFWCSKNYGDAWYPNLKLEIFLEVPGVSIFLTEILRRRLVLTKVFLIPISGTRRLFRISARKMEAPGTRNFLFKMVSKVPGVSIISLTSEKPPNGDAWYPNLKLEIFGSTRRLHLEVFLMFKNYGDAWYLRNFFYSKLEHQASL